MEITFFQANLGGEIIFHLARFVPDYDHIRPFGAWCQRFEETREAIFAMVSWGQGKRKNLGYFGLGNEKLPQFYEVY